MAIALKQSTASQEIPLGPFVDDADGDTQMTALTIANTDIQIWKTGSTSFDDKNSGGATHRENGRYTCVLDATDTDTVGPMIVYVHVADALPVKQECVVLPANIFDSMFSSDKLEVDVVQIAGSTVNTASAQLGVNVVSMAADSITASALAAAAVDEILDDPITDSIPADGALPTIRQALYMLTQFMLERSVSGTTVTVKKVDGSTSLFTLTLSDATNPVSITRAT